MVFGLAHGCLGTAVLAPAAMLVPMPPVLGFEEAATIPTVFITVEMALEEASRMRPSDRATSREKSGRAFMK